MQCWIRLVKQTTNIQCKATIFLLNTAISYLYACGFSVNEGVKPVTETNAKKCACSKDQVSFDIWLHFLIHTRSVYTIYFLKMLKTWGAILKKTAWTVCVCARAQCPILGSVWVIVRSIPAQRQQCFNHYSYSVVVSASLLQSHCVAMNLNFNGAIFTLFFSHNHNFFSCNVSGFNHFICQNFGL